MRRTSIRTTGRPRRAISPGFVRQVAEGAWEIRIQRELQSANKTIWKHWRIKQQEREAWEDALVMAAADYAGVTTRAGLDVLKRSLSLFVDQRPGAAKVRSRIALLRLAPSSRRFVKDDDNLRFAGKHLVDAMKNVGMVSDDSRKWLDLDMPTQEVAPDRQFWTVISLTRVPPMAPLSRDASAVAGGLV